VDLHVRERLVPDLRHIHLHQGSEFRVQGSAFRA
jgi:hypothetical protein